MEILRKKGRTITSPEWVDVTPKCSNYKPRVIARVWPDAGEHTHRNNRERRRASAGRCHGSRPKPRSARAKRRGSFQAAGVESQRAYIAFLFRPLERHGGS